MVDKNNKLKNERLGMSYGAASNRLKRAIVFSMIEKEGIKCYRCGGDMALDNYSIEHKVDWLNNEDPVGTFFDMDNITYSHQSCNSAAAHCPHKKYFTDEDRASAYAELSKKYRRQTPPEVRKERRRARYLEEGR